MAGAGYKLFNTGDVLTAAQVNTYLQEQTVMVFASSAARTSALSGVLAEGMVSYLQDTNAVEVYNGSAWVGVSGAGDVTEVQAGTGISVASGTGPIPVVTNTMATAINAAGDLIYGTGNDAFTRLGIGTAGRVLKVNSGATAPEWAVDPTTDVVTTAGDLIYGTGADAVTRLGIGTAGQVLKVNSGATAPEWGTASAASYAGASAYKSANQTIADGTFVALTFNTEDFDTDAYHNTSTNTSRFTIPSGKGGKYLLSGAVSWAASNAGTFRLVVVYKNGSIENQLVQFAGTNDGTIQPFACVYNLVATDYLEVFVRHNTGGNLDVQGGIQQTRAQVSYLGA